MNSAQLYIYNSLSRKKEEFAPMVPGFVGMYVCGPTVYGQPHLGHARPYITFDVVNRFFEHLGYKVRYVRNITDVGHLENDADEGEDKIAKKARIEKLEPMEIVELYTEKFHEAMRALNNRNVSIEPRASGHIIEQITMIEEIIKNGWAYESNGSVYFDVLKYSKTHDYGKLSGRIIEDLIAGAGNERRELEGQEEKRNPADFALWKKASPEHIMRWPSPWSDGFPGWHIECSAMSTKYLGETFDIHGGGMDLLFPHHESEIAQSKGACGKAPVRYWMHNNMITINGQKMGKSLGNFINLEEFFNGSHKLLEQSYSAMTIRFFVLQAHYRSTLDFSNEGLKGAEKGLIRLLNAHEVLHKIKSGPSSTSDIKALRQACYDAMLDDFNTAITIAQLFEAVRIINSVNAGTETISAEDLDLLKQTYDDFVFKILGLKAEQQQDKGDLDGVMQMVLRVRAEAKTKKDFATSDKIRDELATLGFKIKDEKDGTTSWTKD
ncbi:MAG: cysteine--tRNA ligase [Bacteroidetes bacterium]|nr:cysteine--tRNA ligase [Bacteroidota bacterium]MBL0065246.1 cysteine--tRNA ligase [Bacteroidota bacterium]MBL0138363.1 cysteine--tRNA ligase [Bacteroidota bacterium]